MDTTNLISKIRAAMGDIVASQVEILVHKIEILQKLDQVNQNLLEIKNTIERMRDANDIRRKQALEDGHLN